MPSLAGDSSARLHEELAMAASSAPGGAPESVYLGRFSGKFVAFVLVFTLAALAGVELLTNAFTGHDFNASAPGLLDDNFTQVTSRTNGNVTGITYKVTYTFIVNGQEYKGKDTLGAEPQDPDCTVYYMKSNPAVNALKPGHVDAMLRNSGFACLALALIAYIWAQWKHFAAATDRSHVAAAANLYAVGPPAPEARPRYGDAAGENANFAHGRYSAWGHVHVAFFLEVIALGFLLAMLLSRFGSASMTQARAYGIATVAAILFTLWVYFDRWRCIEAVASKSCSGSWNLSLFYVPIVAAVYANYRGLRKLAGK
jgi:hypothetical protein